MSHKRLLISLVNFFFFIATPLNRIATPLDSIAAIAIGRTVIFAFVLLLG